MENKRFHLGKGNLTIDEAAAYFGIGTNKLWR